MCNGLTTMVQCHSGDDEMVAIKDFRQLLSPLTHTNGCNASHFPALLSLYVCNASLLSLSLCNGSSFPPLPSFFVFHSLSLSLCLRNVPVSVRVCLINAFAIKKFKIPCHVSIVKNESKSFVQKINYSKKFRNEK